MSKSIFLCNPTQAVLCIKPSSYKHDKHRAHNNFIYFLGRQSLIRLSHGVQSKKGSKRNFAVYNSVQPGVPLPSAPPSSGSWKGLLVGVLLTVVLPFLTNKWGPFLKIKSEIDSAVQTVEDVVDAVEKVAEEVEKVAEDIADNLPAGKLKDAVTFIENVADRVDDTTEIVGDVIDKAQEVEENMETAVESTLAEKKESDHDEGNEAAKKENLEASTPN